MQVRAREYSGWHDAGVNGEIAAPELHPANSGKGTMEHIPVMESEVLEFLLHEKSKVILDGTVGAGGHAEAILDRHSGVLLVGVDRDPTSFRSASDRLAHFGNRARLVRGVFPDLDTILSGVGRLDGVLLDLGLSSMQLDDPSRGFSYAADGELDMRMGPEGPSARDWIEGADTPEIAAVLRRNGEVRQAKRIARAIGEASANGDMRTTGDLKAAVERAIGARAKPSELSKVFQAIRIHVNDELGQLDRFLDNILDHMNPAGRIVILSYHSLEDRAVKLFFKVASATCVCPPGTPICNCGNTPRVRVLTRRIVRPSANEVAANVRSRSARLRAAEVLGAGSGQ
jgi:16S rRNA (cytosine1402-N4)-methyltransferase